MNMLKSNEIKSLLKEREATSNKSDYGHGLIIAGRRGMMGAAIISAKAAVRSGVGLLTVCVPFEERMILQTSIPEAMLMMREDDHYKLERFTAIGIGPGMGINPVSEEVLVSVMIQSKVPIVLDADALTILSDNKKLLESLPEKTIITPHVGEFDRLFGVHETQEERINTAITQAKKYDLIIILKGHPTAIITAEEVFYNPTGNAGLAKGGSGDALTGLITSFLAQGYISVNAAKLAVFLHGLAADITLNEQSSESMIISDVIENLGKAFEEIRS